MEIKNTAIWGFEHAIKGMRNPLNSWNKSDSFLCSNNTNCLLEKCSQFDEICSSYGHKTEYIIGENDLKLAQSLIKAGTEHSKFLRMIHVSADFNMPRYFWSEADTYKFIEKNSCSTIHKLLNTINPIKLDLFAYCEEDKDICMIVVERLEELRKEFKEIQNTTKDANKMNKLLLRAKRLLMEGFLQLRTIDTNYAEVRNIWLQRVKHPHKLKEEWVNTFGKWVDSLPYADELIKL